MKIVTHAQFVPGVCLICGGSESDRPWFLDVEKQAEFWGNIYFCNLCCGTMVNLFRCGDVNWHQDRIIELEKSGAEMLRVMEAYESAVAAVRSAPDYRATEFSLVLAHRTPPETEPEVGVSKEPAGSRLAKSSDDEGMDKLSSFEFVSVSPDTTTGW
jgi:hypothetical protein